jgi:hypothetical protein
LLFHPLFPHVLARESVYKQFSNEDATMTIAAVWHDTEGVWVAADTRISRPDRSGSGVAITTDAGAKVYPLPISCRMAPRNLTELATFGPLFYKGTLGLAFAGNVSAASQAIATMSLACGQLTGSASTPPSLDDLASLLGRILKRYVENIREVTNNLKDRGLCDFVIFGKCPASNEMQIRHISDEFDGSEVTIRITDVSTSASFPGVIIGGEDERTRFLSRYAQLRIDNTAARLPKRIVAEMAGEGRGAVGGSVSIGLADFTSEFRVYWTAEPIRYGEPTARRTLNGIDIDVELGRVGPLVIGTFGMG